MTPKEVKEQIKKFAEKKFKDYHWFKEEEKQVDALYGFITDRLIIVSLNVDYDEELFVLDLSTKDKPKVMFNIHYEETHWKDTDGKITSFDFEIGKKDDDYAKGGILNKEFSFKELFKK